MLNGLHPLNEIIRKSFAHESNDHEFYEHENGEILQLLFLETTIEFIISIPSCNR